MDTRSIALSDFHFLCTKINNEVTERIEVIALYLQVFISIALILGDGLYNFVKIIYFTSRSMYASMKQKAKEIRKLDIL